MNTQPITKPIPKIALIGLYDPTEEDEPADLPVYSQGVECQEVAVQMTYLIAQPVVSLELARPYRARVR
jgi:hypothetical protein